MVLPRTIGFVGFGEAARAFVASLKNSAPETAFRAYDIKLAGPEDAAMRCAMDEAGVEVVDDVTKLGEGDWIVSAVTADQNIRAIEPLLPALRPNHLIVDINSVSPGRKQEAAALVRQSGAKYLDMAVMAPVEPRGHKTPVLIAGSAVNEVIDDLGRLGFAFRVVGEREGAATAIKMVRSLFVKGMEALTVETLLAARASGCFDEILSSLSASFPGLDWPEAAAYQFDRTLTHGTRRAAEMEECAATLDQLGLSSELAIAIAMVQRAQGRAGTAARDGMSLADIASWSLRERVGAK